jgi:IS1 family transposase
LLLIANEIKTVLDTFFVPKRCTKKLWLTCCNNLSNVVIKTLKTSKASKIYTDGLKNYRYLIDKKFQSVKQNATNHVKRKNLNLRTHLKKLNRKTICFSWSKIVLMPILKIYFWLLLTSCSLIFSALFKFFIKQHNYIKTIAVFSFLKNSLQTFSKITISKKIATIKLSKIKKNICFANSVSKAF